MKYALILQSDFQNPNYWVCYGLANSLRSLQQHNKCFDPSAKLLLSKVNHKGRPIEQVALPSCVNGMYTTLILCELEGHPGLGMRFEL